MISAHGDRAWYLPAWVSSARPLTSPIAYSQSRWRRGTRMCVIDGDRGAGLEADGLQAEIVGVRRATDGDEQLVLRTARRRRG